MEQKHRARMNDNERRTIVMDEGWGIIQNGINKLINILEGQPKMLISSEDYMTIYETIFHMCTQKPPHDYSQQLYDKYRETFEGYINLTVLPSLREKHDELLLRELVKRWANHKVMIRWLSRFFHYLNRYFVAEKLLPPLDEVGVTCFHDLVYKEVSAETRDVVISLIGKEREGEEVDRALLKNVLDIFVEVGNGKMDIYNSDFEEEMIKETTAYYSRKASNWIVEYSYQDYMLKVEECARLEKERASHYLHSTSEPKLVERVQHELVAVYSDKLVEKEEQSRS